MNKDNIFFVIPAYNEGQSIGNVLNELHDSGFHSIVVVDDGSTDGTSEAVQKTDAILIEHIINRGQGAALSTGFEYCQKVNECKCIVTFDADGQHRVEDAEKMAELLLNSDSDIVLGSRFLDLKNESIPTGRKLMLKLASYFLRFIYGLKISDAHNGLRVIKKESAYKIMPATDGMLHASEMIYLIKKNKLKYMESPVKINYSAYSLAKGQKTSGFAYMGFLTIYHKIILLLFEKD